MTELNSKSITSGENIFAITMIVILFPLVLLGILFDIITKNRTLYINVYRPWKMRLGDRPNSKDI